MLKAYHEKPKPELVTLNNKLGLENPMHSEDCADLEAKKEEKRKELTEVINQYRDVFPDVPNKTNLIEHDLDVGDSAPIKQHPYR